MKQKPFTLIALIALAVVGSTAAKNIEPFIDPTEGYIKMASTWGLCGGLLIRPIAANIEADEGFDNARLQLRAVIYSSEYSPKKEVGRMILGPEGIRTTYRWGMAFRPQSHYRIFCEKVNIARGGEEVIQPIDCNTVVTIDRIKHNRPCVIGPAGPGGTFAPLNMK